MGKLFGRRGDGKQEGIINKFFRQTEKHVFPVVKDALKEALAKAAKEALEKAAKAAVKK